MRDLFTPLGVSEVIEVFNETLSVAHPAVMVEGEVASFKINHGKFVFFDIKDAKSSLGCFMMAFQIKFPIEDGMKVRLLAEPQLTTWGKFSLTVREVVPIGEGSLKKSQELLRSKLESEGLFDSKRKRDLPKMPQRIGVVSSEGAAGYADFMKVLQNRWSGLSITLVHVPVQGAEAAKQIIGALEYLNQLVQPMDVIALVRGGGSADDLSVFNHESVVRAVAASRAPTIAGVGHETDTTLVDFAADRRAATPSNAAELLVPDKKELDSRLAHARRIAESGAMTTLQVLTADVAAAKESAEKGMNNFFIKKNDTLRHLQQTLRQLDPSIVLSRGYSIMRNEGGATVRKRGDVTIGSSINIEITDGIIGAKVSSVKSKQ